MSVLNILCVHRVILDCKVFLVIVASLNPLGIKVKLMNKDLRGLR